MPGKTISSLGAESSRKRPRQSVSLHDHDGDDDRVVDVQRAQSGHRGNITRKRPRVSDASSVKDDRRGHRPSTPSSTSDQSPDGSSSDEEGPTQRRARNVRESPDSPPKTQYELLRDANFDHLRHEAADDQRATQRLRFGRNLMGENHVADNGIIESITCVNFMCHERLHCELGPLLNFIVGENGSGKSAILTAITLCLGGKASSTNRGGSLKSFVKEGRERAVLTVKIKNRGQDAYKYDLYGDSIIVERHFSKTGSSGFKVKSALDRTISTKKQEVEEIVEYYALQVDNPLNVLSQDNARQFLNTSTKAQKYKFFIEGVQLQQLDNDYRLISESLEQMIAKVPDQEERVKLAKENLNKAMQLKETIEGNRQIRVKYRTLRNQMVWAQVVEEERELAKRENAVHAAREEVAKAEAEVVEKGQRLAVLDEKIERAQEALNTLKEGSQDLIDREKQLREEHEAARKELANLHQEEREAHSSFKTAKENVATLSKSIADEEKRLEDTNGDAHAAKTQELQDVRNDAQLIEAEISSNKSRIVELKKQLDNEAKPAVGRLADEFAQKRTEVEAAAAKVRDIQKTTRGLYDGYEKQVPNLLKLIAEEKGFSEKPIGPFGAHIKLMKPEWSSIVETSLGGNLNGFLVTNVKDKSILSGLMARLGIVKCPIFISRRNTLDLSGKEPAGNFDTVLRIMKIENLLVRDQLIINNSIEQLVLIPDRREGQEVMFPAGGGPGPQNVKAVYCFHDTIRGAGLRLTNRRGGDDISTEPVRAYTGPARMQSDTDSQLAFQKDVLRQLEDECRTLENEKRRAQQDVQRLDSELARLTKENRGLDSRLRKVRVKEDSIQEDLDKFDGADGRLQGLRKQLADADTSRDHYGSQYGTLKNLKIEKNKVAEETKAKADEAKMERADHASRIGKAEDKLRGFENTRRLILTEVNEANSAVEICKEAAEEAERKRVRQAGHVATCVQQASAHSERRMHIPENETYKTIEKQYEVLGKRLAEEEKKTGMSDTQVNEYLIEAKKAHEKAVLDLESIKKVNAGLLLTLNQRLEKWRKFQRYISAQSRANFLYLLSERGFRGKLMLDHERKALDLQVEPDKTEKRAAGRSTKTLSGGEKSFSSICLLLAIWEAMGSPLRCLDEFDVFMDNVNRAISTNMLITAARRSVNRQYIFITPNAIEGRSTLDKDVKIIRLTDPRQRTLVDH